MDNLPENNIQNNTPEETTTPSNAQITSAPEQNVNRQGYNYNQQVASQGFQPTYVPPVYNNQYQPQQNMYGAHSYTAPNTMPYNTPYNNTGFEQPSPSAIYNNTPMGNAPQYHHNDPSFNVNFNNAYYHERQQALAKRREAERKIKSIGNLAGAALLCCFCVAVLFSSILVIPSVYDFYENSVGGQSYINLLYTLVVVGGTFLIFDKKFRKHGNDNNGYIKNDFKPAFSKPKNTLQAFLLIMVSFGGCMLANYISSFLMSIFSMFGFHSTYSAIEDPKTIPDLIIMCISIAVLPALIEEFAMRGSLLSALRKYGSSFAIIASAFIFGIFHGEATQIPFAFICGIFFAYTVIATESIWPAIIIHALNNSLSCISSVLMQVADEEVANTFFSVTSFGGIIFGAICLFFYITKFKNDGVLSFKGDAYELTTGQKFKKFITSPCMIVAIIVYGVQALGTLATS